MKRSQFLCALAVVCLTGTLAKAETKDIVDTAVGAGQFTTLVKAVQAAGLVDTLKSPGPFTVFAPTDEAFAKLPAGTLEPGEEVRAAAIRELQEEVGRHPGTVEVLGGFWARWAMGG